MKFEIRKIAKSDMEELLTLYKKSANVSEGLARTSKEITKEHITHIVEKSVDGGLGIAATLENGQIVGCLLSFKHEPLVFKHTLGNMTMAVDPDFFGNGLGKLLFENFINEVQKNRHDIARVELNVRQTNKLAIKIYESVGFKIEGIQKNRVLNSKGELDDDTMMSWFNPNFKT